MMASSPPFALTISSSVHIEASRTVVLVAGAVVFVIVLLLVARAAMPLIGAGLMAATLSSAIPTASPYAGDRPSHGFVPPTPS
jgi:hypothetical protein